MSFASLSNIKARLFIQGDLIIYGYGGFYQQPKGWGMDLAYFRRSDFKGLLARKNIENYIQGRVQALVKSGLAHEQFLPRFMAHLMHVCMHEWHYEQARVLFEFARVKIPAFKRYDDFNQFAGECMGGTQGTSPDALLAVVKERVNAMANLPIEKIIHSKRGLIARHATDVLRRVLEATFGSTDGTYIFNKVKDEGGADISLIMDGTEKNYLLSKAFYTQIQDFYAKRMKAYTEPKYVHEALRTLKVEKNSDTRIKRARRDAVRGFKEIHPELRALLAVLRMPIFIAVDDNANFFRNFFNTIPLFVAKGMDELQEYLVFGLCMYQPAYQGGLIVTHGGRSYARFWHTLVEETMHLSDGPTDRMTLAGHHRYSGKKAFRIAYEQDKALNPPWASNNVLGPKEWAQSMTLKKFSSLRAAYIKKRVEKFEATMDFEHYRPRERDAEVFAALAIVERAVGQRVMKKIMPNLFAYYTQDYMQGLASEVDFLKDKVKS